MRHRSMLVLALASAVAAVSGRAPARADAPEAATARLGYLSPAERKLLSPFLEQGPIALVEFAEDTELPALVVATQVRAPAREVADIVRNVEAYPRFMPALDEVRVSGNRGPTTSYEWVWRTAIFTLKGRNVMTEYPAGRGGRRPHAFGVRSVQGDLGAGRFMWQVFPEGEDRSLLLLASRLDMRHANWIAEQLSAGGNGVNRTINLSLAFLMLLSTKAQAEGGNLTFAPRGGREPFLRVPRLRGLLRRGDLVLLDMRGGRLDDVRVIGRMGRSEEVVRSVVTEPENFGGALLQGSRARVVSREEDRVVFDWKIPLPLVGSSGRMRLWEQQNGVVAVDALSGGLSGGKWRFAIHPWGHDAALVGWARFDPAKTSWLLERLVRSVPYFREGVSAASQVMVIRSIRTQARDYSP
ncbi:MAG: hypothetical protein ACODAU_08740 [Myxococcota bacterium]